jgi:hypothetical protein
MMGRTISQDDAPSAVRRAERSARRVVGLLLAAVAGVASFAASAPASAQEIQLTGPLAGAPAVRSLRLHREKRFEIAPSVSFTLLDEYQRTILPGVRATYHFTDWIGVGVWGGFGIHYTTGLTDELQEKAIDGRRCDVNRASRACTLTAVNLTTGQMDEDQLGALGWVVAPQLTVVPFRGKLALFSQLFVDTDVNLFIGPAFIGLQERAPCGFDNDDAHTKLATPCSDSASFTLESRLAVAPTFGLGLNFYPSPFIGFGAEWRGLPYSWNTSGFDNRGAGNGEDFPDTAVNGDDREFHFNSMMTLNVLVHFPTALKQTD